MPSGYTKKRTPIYLAIDAILHQYPETPEGDLWSAVLRRTILDLHHETTKYSRTAAAHLLLEEIPEAEICGVDSDWIRAVLFSNGVVSRLDLVRLAYSKK